MGATAIIVPFEAADRAVSRWRRAYTTDGAEGVPAHVTLIYPFIDDAELAAGHVQGLRAVLAPYASFDVRFATFGRFPGPPPVLYLEPHPAQPFLDMINAIVECFPAYSPFGQFDPLVPHLTVAQINDTRVLQVAETRVASQLPIATRASEVHILEHLGTDGWRTRHRIHL